MRQHYHHKREHPDPSLTYRPVAFQAEAHKARSAELEQLRRELTDAQAAAAAAPRPSAVPLSLRTSGSAANSDKGEAGSNQGSMPATPTASWTQVHHVPVYACSCSLMLEPPRPMKCLRHLHISTIQGFRTMSSTTTTVHLTLLPSRPASLETVIPQAHRLSNCCFVAATRAAVNRRQDVWFPPGSCQRRRL